MKTNGKEKNFSNVKTMREIRDQISREIMNMTFAEEKAYLKDLVRKSESPGVVDQQPLNVEYIQYNMCTPSGWREM